MTKNDINVKEIIEQNEYTVSITGKNMCFKIIIKDKDGLKTLEKFIDKFLIRDLENNCEHLLIKEQKNSSESSKEVS